MTTREAPPPWPQTAASIWLRRIGYVLAGVLIVAILALATLLWGLRNETASAWIVRWLPGIEVIGPHGALLGDFSARRVEIERANGGRIVITHLRWRDMRLDHDAGIEPFLQLRAASVTADRVDLLNPPAGTHAEPASEGPPHDLRLPYALEVGALRIGAIHTPALGATPLRNLQARLQLSADGGRLHRIDDLSVARGPLHLQGDVQIQTGGALDLDVHLWLQQRSADPATSVPVWSAAVGIQGPLAQAIVKATLRSAAQASLDLDATLRPFAPWPIARLSAQMESLDLAVLAPGLPQTQLNGQAELTSATGQPIVASVDLRNDAAGPWNEQRLPVRSARIDLRGQAADLSTLELQTLVVQLGAAAQPAGQLQGSGHWGPQGWTLQTTVTGLRPARLDARLPPMQLGGPLNVKGSGFTSVTAGTGTAAAPTASGSAAARPAAAAQPPTQPAIDVQADLAGELLGTSRPAAGASQVKLTLAARASAYDIVLERFAASAGGATAEGHARARRGAGDAWQLSGHADLKDFDPAPWLASRANPAWRRALHRLNAAADWDLTLPPTPADAQAGLVDHLDELRGKASLTLARSTLAGVPLSGSAALQADAGQPLQATARLEAAGNRLRVKLEVQAAGTTPWTADLDADAPALARLAPWLQLAGLEAGAPLGSLQATARASGQRSAPAAGAAATWQIDSVDVSRLEATSGDGRLAGRGRAEHHGNAWQLDGQASLKAFDPSAWLATRSSSRPARSRLNGDARWNIEWPALAQNKPPPAKPLQRLADVRGEAALKLSDSLLAGVPLTATARLSSTPPAGHLQAALQIEAGGNRLQLDAKVDARGDGADDRWNVQADAPLLARLAPLLQLAGIDGDVSGAIDAEAHVNGRWPHVTSRGHASARQLRSKVAGGSGVAQAALDWRLGSAADAPAELQIDLTRAHSGKLQIDRLHGQLQGSAAAHTFALQADIKGGPPLWTEKLQALNATTATAATAATAATTTPAQPSPGEHTRLELQADGSLDTRAAPSWHGTLQRLELRSNQGRAWAAVHDVALALQAAGDTTPAAASVSAGQARLLGAAVRWDHIQWRGASAAAPAQIDLRAEVEPLPVAPLLQQMQPDFGWGGDLRIGASINVHSAPQFTADIVLQRSRGDLTVTEDTQTQTLGLTDVRLALNADQGLWNFTAALAGSRMGAAAAAVSVRTDPARYWPPPEAAIEGVLEAHVTDLGSWGTWLPPGWRLTGQIHSTASIGGRFGAPELTGTITGHDIGARNIVEGINVSNGELKVTLQGKTARVERLLVHGGQGTAELQGVIDLGSGLSAAAPAEAHAAPPLQAQLQLHADHFQLLGRVDRRIVMSGQARLRVDGSKLDVDGRFDVDEGLIDITRSDAPALSDDVVVIRAAEQTKPAAAAGVEAAPVSTPYKLTLDLVVGLGQNLKLRGHGIETGLRGELKITSPDGKLAVNGSVHTFKGTFDAYGQKLQVDRGIITFTGAIANPRLDILATRPDLDVVVGVAITGNAVDPRIRLYSEPDMSDIDKLSYLMLGHASDGLGGSDVALLQSAALALLSGEGQGPSKSFTKALGLDSLSISQGESGGLRDAVVSVGKQISRRWYVGYEQSLNATAGSFQLIYRLARRFTLRAQSGSDNSIDVIWTWRFQ